MPTNSKWYRDKKRKDGKTNYEHYQWTKKRKVYRSKLNSANRKKWDYWNWDWLDLQHKDNNPKNFSPSNLKKWSMVANRKKWAAKATKKKKDNPLHYV